MFRSLRISHVKFRFPGSEKLGPSRNGRMERNFLVIPIFRNFWPTSRGTPKILELNSRKYLFHSEFSEFFWSAPPRFSGLLVYGLRPGYENLCLGPVGWRISDGHLHLYQRMISRSTDYYITCYIVLTRPNKVEIAVHGCNSWLSVWTLSCRCLLINPFTPKSDLIDFDLSNTRQFYSSMGDPLGVKGLIFEVFAVLWQGLNAFKTFLTR